MVMFLSSSFLNLTVWTPEMAFTTVDFPWATWPMVPGTGRTGQKPKYKQKTNESRISVPMLMVACLLMISGERGVRVDTSWGHKLTSEQNLIPWVYSWRNVTSCSHPVRTNTSLPVYCLHPVRTSLPVSFSSVKHFYFSFICTIRQNLAEVGKVPKNYAPERVTLTQHTFAQVKVKSSHLRNDLRVKKYLVKSY